MIVKFFNQVIDISSIKQITKVGYHYRTGGRYYGHCFEVGFGEGPNHIFWAEENSMTQPEEPKKIEHLKAVQKRLEELYDTYHSIVDLEKPVTTTNEQPKNTEVVAKAKKLLDELDFGWGMDPNIKIGNDDIINHLCVNLG